MRADRSHYLIVDQVSGVLILCLSSIHDRPCQQVDTSTPPIQHCTCSSINAQNPASRELSCTVHSRRSETNESARNTYFDLTNTMNLNNFTNNTIGYYDNGVT